MTTINQLDELGAGRYLLLTTFRKDGTSVPTPVWTVRDADSLLVWSAAEAGKVKRIRRDPAVRLAPCTARGVATGPEVAGRAQLLAGEESRAAQRLVTGRYGIVGRITALGSRLRRGPDGGIAIRITVNPSQTLPETDSGS